MVLFESAYVQLHHTAKIIDLYLKSANHNDKSCFSAQIQTSQGLCSLHHAANSVCSGGSYLNSVCSDGSYRHISTQQIRVYDLEMYINIILLSKFCPLIDRFRSK
ncbi:hypothetical protein KP509_39G052300 [Ceratopteris richardii]|uniref:Uncharacterized protein n=1 Tax=Ceratopteris richardii TaxID=49495 RepID=A0A8T2Q1C0_CERRI|nr:hypothetical protein KP509_39G052300 [Ceratopteris richardii]